MIRVSISMRNGAVRKAKEFVKELKEKGKTTPEVVNGTPLGVGIRREWKFTDGEIPQVKPADIVEGVDGITVTYYPIKLDENGKRCYTLKTFDKVVEEEGAEGKVEKRIIKMPVEGQPVMLEKTEFFPFKPDGVIDKIKGVANKVMNNE